ncbi:MAG: hypothetical protein MUO63_21635, partial [Desulfobulbaceae bacterium]|nr:hypothetical protein [Desulfobulbaceae bacterium]
GDPLDGGVMIGSKIIIAGVLGAGESALAETDWLVPDDVQSHVVFVIVDPDDVVSELDEFNNSISSKLMLADLTFVGGRNEWVGKDKVQLVAAVNNSGASLAQDIPVEFVGSDNVVLHSETITMLAPGLTTEIGYLWPVNQQLFSGCQTSITVRINNGRSVEEADYINNYGAILVIEDPAVTCCGVDRDDDSDVDGLDLAEIVTLMSSETVDLSCVAAAFGQHEN